VSEDNGSQEVTPDENADVGDSVGEGLGVFLISVEEFEDAIDHERS
jgi:hypothetical protein